MKMESCQKDLVKLFFSEMVEFVDEYNKKTSSIYRELSEFVHGNNETWTKSGLTIKYNDNLKNDYFVVFDKISDVIIFALCNRYLKSFNKIQLDSLSIFLLEEMKHVSAIREYLEIEK